MVDPLYQKEILRLAAAADGAGRLAAPTVTAAIKNPLCGDMITVDLELAGGRIKAMAHATRACVLCQASAALLARHAAGHDRVDLATASERLRGLLDGTASAAWPDGFADFQVFAAVAPHPHRHTCVLLPFQAAEKAFAAAGTPA